MVPSIKDTVGGEIEESAVSQGQMARLQYDVFNEVILKTIRPEYQRNIYNNGGHLFHNSLGDGVPLYSNQGRLWDVAEDFDFSKQNKTT